MTDDLPDWLGLTLFKAVDEDGNLVTVLVDASGAMFAVMKGEYSGALQTVKLDADHRMIARVIGSISDTVQKTWGTATGLVNHTYDFPAVPTGKLWKVINIAARDTTRSITSIIFSKRISPHDYSFYEDASPAGGYYSFWQGEVWAKAGQIMRVYFAGSQAGDSLEAKLLGVEIDAE